ncbi:MAG: penicillin acylase family protein [Ignavibacteria bacterium]|jgi:penicillin amidase|nr:penicillin acylase family protein [Ignavibacteria bacterium]MCU7499433.1 penicillin acylase family protein [Ignavibacteria bacterium]MCU7512735.1 penicillin acylase family protein [Ignavibacteria bacterium]MCU7522641.1 penicillin acylase family protein [Ignavibacteria bacterium]MCU7524445.1 penicillin acylase family protein [Ignavibacteria bacterium]
MPNWMRNSIAIVVSLLVVAAVGAVLFYRLLNKSLPEYEGDKQLGGLSHSVEIYTDQYAIPHIYAEEDEDAAYALGYLHASERLFQMDVERRAGEGRLSEVFGSKTLPYDRMFKTIGIDRTVKRDMGRLNPQYLSLLNAYSNGVNAYIRDAKGRYPVEFDALGYDPYPWKPEHSLIIGKLMAWELNISWWTDIAFSNLVQKLGEEKVKEILPDYPENAPTIIPSGLKTAPEVTTAFIETDRSFRNFAGFGGTHIGSNNWVVNSLKSASGKPIIANDPHLALQAPGKWYAAVIRGRNWKAEGVTLPGVPGVVIGKNENISWVMTNVMADDADFYMEKIDSTGKKYFFNNAWQDLKSYRYTIHVKDSDDVQLTVKETHRGPVVSEIHPYNTMFPDRNRKKAVLSMRWTGSEFSDELYAIMAINMSKNWGDFRQAVSHYYVPGQNFVYADKTGNIGYICGARLPIRSSVSPTFVCDGTTDAYDWKGYVPFEQMPSLFNPSENYIASANNKTVNNFGYHISNLWEPPSRIERINELLTAKQKHSVQDFMQYQADFVSPYAREMTPYIISAFNEVKVKDRVLSGILNLFKTWNYSLEEGSQLPAVFEVFFQFLLRNTFEDEMGKSLYDEYVFTANVPYRSIMKMLKENKSTWFDNVNTKNVESRDDIIRRSFIDAMRYLESHFSSSVQDWQWGRLHTVTFKHLFHGRLGALDRFIDIGPYEVGGSGTSLFNTEYSFNDPYETILGPSMRYIFDFSKPDEFYLILTTGQSGNVLSRHYKDMTEMWLKGRYVRVATGDREVRTSGYKLMTLR